MDEQEKNTPLGLSDILSDFSVERPETLRHGDWVDRFRLQPEKYTLLNPEDVSLEMLIDALKKAERVLLPVLSDFTTTVLVQDNPETHQRTSWVESDKGQFLFLRIERQKGYLEVIPTQVKTVHEENAEHMLSVSDNYWTVMVNARFYPHASLEDLHTDMKNVPVKFNEKVEVLIIHNINGKITISFAPTDAKY